MFSISRRVYLYIVFFMTLLTTVSAKSDTNDKLVNSLEKAIDAWIIKMEFKCEYTHSEGVVADERATSTFSGKFDKDTFKCQGIFAKSGDKALLSQYVQYDFYTPLQSMDGVWVVNDLFAANYIPANPELGTNHNPEKKKEKPSILLVFEREKERKYIPCPIAAGIVCDVPTVYASGPLIPNPITLLKTLQKYAPKSRIEYKKIGSNLIEVSMNFEDENGNENYSSVFINTEYSYPVPIRHTSKVIYRNGNRYFEEIEASDFVDVGNGVMVPKKISSYYGPLHDGWGKEYEGKWKVRRWSTDKLEKPNDSDFKIKISPGSKFWGFNINKEKEYNKLGMETFDLSTLSTDDLQNPITITPEINRPRLFFVRLVLVIAGAVMIIIACFRILMKRFFRRK